MDIKPFFKKDLILINKTYSSKNEALSDFSKLLVEHKYAKNADQVLALAKKREAEFSTGIGNKIAIPHIRDDVMNNSVVLFAKVAPLDWQSLDNQKVEYIFFIAMNASTGATSHLEVIAGLSRLFMKQDFVNQLQTVSDYESLLKLIESFINDNEENKKAPDETQEKIKADKLNNLAAPDDKSAIYDVVAITACPTGIAHTFMAAQRLEDAAKLMNIKIKVETQGTEGPKNTLTQKEINEAKGVILAVDKVIDTSRFSGKNNVLELGTKAVIKDSKYQIERILKNEGKKMPGEIRSGNSSQSLGNDFAGDLYSFKGFGKRLWKSVMNGVSYMLPFVIFGGILIALSFLIDINNASTAQGNFGKSIPAALWFNSLGSIAFSVIVPILCAYISYGLVGKMGLLPGFVCGFISSGQFLFDLNPETGAIDWFKPSATGASSGFFGAIIGGFISAIGIIIFSKYIFGKLPKSLNGIKNILFIPLFGTLAIAAVFWIVNIPLIYLNYGFFQFLDIMSAPYLAPLLGLVIGIMMASDLGGPINKAAYVFATASLTSSSSNSGGTIAMAASMLSGMVPPLSIAFAATFFKKLYDKETRAAAFTNYIMGISFVSEGAIPFTAENPRAMVPANLVGGGIAGLLSGALGITLQAPHGGIFVFALVKSDINASWNASTQIGAGVGFALLSIIVAAIISAFIIFFLTKAFKKSKPHSYKATKMMNFKNWFKAKNKGNLK